MAGPLMEWIELGGATLIVLLQAVILWRLPRDCGHRPVDSRSTGPWMPSGTDVRKSKLQRGPIRPDALKGDCVYSDHPYLQSDDDFLFLCQLGCGSRKSVKGVSGG